MFVAKGIKLLTVIWTRHRSRSDVMSSRELNILNWSDFEKIIRIKQWEIYCFLNRGLSRGITLYKNHVVHTRLLMALRQCSETSPNKLRLPRAPCKVKTLVQIYMNSSQQGLFINKKTHFDRQTKILLKSWTFQSNTWFKTNVAVSRIEYACM